MDSLQAGISWLSSSGPRFHHQGIPYMIGQRFARFVAPSAASVLLCAAVTVLGGPQESAKDQPSSRDRGSWRPTYPSMRIDRVEAQIDKTLAAYDLKPRPAPPVPDDPPPHEGNMIGLPYVVEAPDLVLVEVLEA